MGEATNFWWSDMLDQSKFILFQMWWNSNCLDNRTMFPLDREGKRQEREGLGEGKKVLWNGLGHSERSNF